jgi:hypothetical protein
MNAKIRIITKNNDPKMIPESLKGLGMLNALQINFSKKRYVNGPVAKTMLIMVEKAVKGLINTSFGAGDLVAPS